MARKYDLKVKMTLQVVSEQQVIFPSGNAKPHYVASEAITDILKQQAHLPEQVVVDRMLLETMHEVLQKMMAANANFEQFQAGEAPEVE